MRNRAFALLILGLQAGCMPGQTLSQVSDAMLPDRDYFPLAAGATWAYQDRYLTEGAPPVRVTPASTISITAVDSTQDQVIAHVTEVRFTGTGLGLGDEEPRIFETIRYRMLRTAGTILIDSPTHTPNYLGLTALDKGFTTTPVTLFKLLFPSQPVHLDAESADDRSRKSARTQVAKTVDSVSTEFGAFPECVEVLQVETTSTPSEDLSIRDGMIHRTPFTIESTQSLRLWFAPGIGIVKRRREVEYWYSNNGSRSSYIREAHLATYSVPVGD